MSRFNFEDLILLDVEQHDDVFSEIFLDTNNSCIYVVVERLSKFGICQDISFEILKHFKGNIDEYKHHPYISCIREKLIEDCRYNKEKYSEQGE